MVFDWRVTRHGRFRFCVETVVLAGLVASVGAFSSFAAQSGFDVTGPETPSVSSPAEIVKEDNSVLDRPAMPVMPAVCVALIVLSAYALREAYRRTRLM